ncbi:MAG TPA: peptidylprolyl isomerase [Gammaproteobacteria bacterium]|jgi:FKBP-type peptidyl-prolyl cis-trans isomerase SlyD|nr:peptidylprolyl isomerase [Gammaproteobacteria bacterium]
MRIAKHSVVSIDYTLTDADGTVLDSSKGQEPLTYIHGTGGIVVGLEEALEGKEKGASLKVSVPPEKGYGKRDDNLSQKVPRSMFDVEDLSPGMRFHAEAEHGSHVVTITAVDDDNVTVDANHPLAGATLNFDITVMDVRAATPDELAHGHVHGPHGHDH